MSDQDRWLNWWEVPAAAVQQERALPIFLSCHFFSLKENVLFLLLPPSSPPCLLDPVPLPSGMLMRLSPLSWQWMLSRVYRRQECHCHPVQVLLLFCLLHPRTCIQGRKESRAGRRVVVQPRHAMHSKAEPLSLMPCRGVPHAQKKKSKGMDRAQARKQKAMPMPSKLCPPMPGTGSAVFTRAHQKARRERIGGRDEREENNNRDANTDD